MEHPPYKLVDKFRDVDVYEILGVEPNCTNVELDKAYRGAALQKHPDKNLDDPNAAEDFKELREMYDLLKNSNSRWAYDLANFGNSQSPYQDLSCDDPTGNQSYGKREDDGNQSRKKLNGCLEARRKRHKFSVEREDKRARDAGALPNERGTESSEWANKSNYEQYEHPSALHNHGPRIMAPLPKERKEVAIERVTQKLLRGEGKRMRNLRKKEKLQSYKARTKARDDQDQDQFRLGITRKTAGMPRLTKSPNNVQQEVLSRDKKALPEKDARRLSFEADKLERVALRPQ